MQQIVKIFTVFALLIFATSATSWADSQQSVGYARVLLQIRELNNSGMDRHRPEYKKQIGKLMLQSMEMYYQRAGDERRPASTASPTGGYEFNPVAGTSPSDSAQSGKARVTKKAVTQKTKFTTFKDIAFQTFKNKRFILTSRSAYNG